MLLQGYIGTFWEPNMDEPGWFVFQEQAWAESTDLGRTREGFHQLLSGQRLSIFSPEYSLLWAGVLEARREGLLGHKVVSPYEPTWHPDDVSLERWQSWFHQSPPLRAELSR